MLDGLVVGKEVEVELTYIDPPIRVRGFVVQFDHMEMEVLRDQAQVIVVRLSDRDATYMRLWDLEGWGPWVEQGEDPDQTDLRDVWIFETRRTQCL
jgi:hypothetical protein